MIKKIIVLATIILLIFSCKKSNLEESNKYQIISFLFEELAKPVELVYGPNYSGEPLTRKDSAHQDSLFESIRKERAKRKFIIAVYPKLIPYKGGHYKYGSKKCIEYYEIMDKLMKLKDSSAIDLNKIISTRYDSIVPFSVDLLSKDTKEFIKFDYFISFSPVAFDESYTKSIVLVSGSRSKLAGSTDLYMLEKENGKWVIKCKINLEIS